MGTSQLVRTGVDLSGKITATADGGDKIGAFLVYLDKPPRETSDNETLANYYKTNFAMMQHHKYSLTELENMLPYEREIYLGLLENYIREENERIERENNS